LLIDANLRRPVLHKLFKLSKNGGGFSDVLNDKIFLEEAVIQENERLGILPAGSMEKNPLTLFDNTKIAETLRRAGELYDVVLIDSSNLKDFRDTEVLSSSVDGVVLVLEAGHSRRQTVKSYLASLEQKK